MDYGALVRNSKRADDHAALFYERARNSKDYLNVSKNTGFSIEQTQAIQNYLFKDYHYLNGNTISVRFEPCYEIAESWRRLSERSGIHIEKHDIVLLQHELTEIKLLLSNSRMSQSEAHSIASKMFPYDIMSEKYYKDKRK